MPKRRTIGTLVEATRNRVGAVGFRDKPVGFIDVVLEPLRPKAQIAPQSTLPLGTLQGGRAMLVLGPTAVLALCDAPKGFISQGVLPVSTADFGRIAGRALLDRSRARHLLCHERVD